MAGNGLTTERSARTAVPQTVNEMCDRYQEWSDDTYQKPALEGGRRPTRNASTIYYALRPLREVAGDKAPGDVRAEDLYDCQKWMITHGHCRNAINRHIRRIRTAFRWAARPGRRFIDAAVVHDLTLVEPVKYGRTAARESEPVKPAPEELVEAVLPHLPHVLATMVRVQLALALRPGEVCVMRPCDLDTSGDLWVFRPCEHKLQHHGIERKIPVPPMAQAMLTPFMMDRDPHKFMFSPAEVVGEMREQRRKRRKTPASCGNHSGTNRTAKPLKQPGDRYNASHYGNAVRRVLDRVFPPPEHLARRRVPGRGRKARQGRWETNGEWRARLEAAGLHGELERWRKEHRFAMNQLRHSAATRIRKEHGLDVARAILGHRTVETTQIYAEQDWDAAARAMAAMG